MCILNEKRNVEKAILVGCEFPHINGEQFTYSMAELKSLTETARGTVITTFTQRRSRINPAFYIGKGKLEEISQFILEAEVDVIIFNDELSSGQLKNITEYLGVKIIDRTQLILDIFAARAHSKEGKLQVELAQLEYMLPRLVGQGVILSRLGGGIGTRGPGETQLETDRRHINRRIQAIKNQLEKVKEHRAQYKERRKRNEVLQVALVGYTNAGKSTIFNRLTEGNASYEEDQLFATLDPITRKMRIFQQYDVLITDTVGFIQDLPTELIAAFKSTLEEVTEADLILHIVDAADENYVEHERTVNRLLTELHAEKIPTILVYNKKDLLPDDYIFPLPKDGILTSAFDPADIKKLHAVIDEKMRKQMIRYSLKVRPEEGKLLSQLEAQTVLFAKEWVEDENVFLINGLAPSNVANLILKEH